MFGLEIVCSNLSLTDGCNSRKNQNLCPEVRVGRAASPALLLQPLPVGTPQTLCACREVLKHGDPASDPPWHWLFSIQDASSFSVLSGQLWPEAQALFGLESKETRKKCVLVWFVLVASRFPMALPCPCTEQALRDGICGGSISFTLALGTLGLYLLPKNIPAGVPAPRGLCLNCECCVNTAGHGAGSACTSCERASPANPP